VIDASAGCALARGRVLSAWSLMTADYCLRPPGASVCSPPQQFRHANEGE